MSDFKIGTGKADITDPAVGLGMQGWADPLQKTQGVESKLYSRAFVIQHKSEMKYVALVVVDLWGCSEQLKARALSRVASQVGPIYDQNNVMISATHQHSGAGGYLGFPLYDRVAGGFDYHNVECIVSGIADSLIMAHQRLRPGRIYLGSGAVGGENHGGPCGLNRSPLAYLNNPVEERRNYKSDTDKIMFTLSFRAIDDLENDNPRGLISWYPIHPTDRGQQNDKICGDSKGLAASMLESYCATHSSNSEEMIAAFANSNCGDVSGNVEYGRVPDGITDRSHMEKHAGQQFEAAKDLLSTGELLMECLDYAHTRLDLANIQIESLSNGRTYPAALGLSFAAGSSEDGVPNPNLGIPEGATDADPSVYQAIIRTLANVGAPILGLPPEICFTDDIKKGHSPKAIVVALGASCIPPVPQFLPLQLIRIGSAVVLGFPGEITTMAGRRLRSSVLSKLAHHGVKEVILSGYSNEYSQYVTTREEYAMQHYEGASTLYGPHTLEAYMQEFSKLAVSLDGASPARSTPHTPIQYSPSLRRMTIRNSSRSECHVECFGQADSVRIIPLPDGRFSMPPSSDRAWIVPGDIGSAMIVVDGSREVLATVGDLVTVGDGAELIKSAYQPFDSSQPRATRTSK